MKQSTDPELWERLRDEHADLIEKVPTIGRSIPWDSIATARFPLFGANKKDDESDEQVLPVLLLLLVLLLLTAEQAEARMRRHFAEVERCRRLAAQKVQFQKRILYGGPFLLAAIILGLVFGGELLLPLLQAEGWTPNPVVATYQNFSHLQLPPAASGCLKNSSGGLNRSDADASCAKFLLADCVSVTVKFRCPGLCALAPKSGCNGTSNNASSVVWAPANCSTAAAPDSAAQCDTRVFTAVNISRSGGCSFVKGSDEDAARCSERFLGDPELPLLGVYLRGDGGSRWLLLFALIAPACVVLQLTMFWRCCGCSTSFGQAVPSLSQAAAAVACCLPRYLWLPNVFGAAQVRPRGSSVCSYSVAPQTDSFLSRWAPTELRVTTGSVRSARYRTRVAPSAATRARCRRRPGRTRSERLTRCTRCGLCWW